MTLQPFFRLFLSQLPTRTLFSLRQLTNMSLINPSKGRDAAIFGEDEAIAKRQKLTGPSIGTHNGHFHADEALAVYLLRLLPTYQSSPLVRTRNPEQLAKCHTVVDVGGEYDIAAKRFDHHQRGFDVTFPGRNTKLSAAGLVYKDFGHDIISQVTSLPKDSPDTPVLYKQLYSDLIEAFDANDNGIDVFDSAALESNGIKPRFDNIGFSLASVVKRYNYSRDEEEAQLSPEERQAREDSRFERASAFVGEQFLLTLTELHTAWLPARAIVREAFAKRFDVHSSGAIMKLPHRDGGLPWSDHLYSAEEEAGPEAKVLYVLFPETGANDSKWRIRSVSVGRGSFKNRKDMPDAWKGVRDQALSDVAGIPGCVFVHASGFIGGNLTYEGALQMAIKAVEL